jgi:dihydroceramide fatty acyl 2-hydroxylase
MLVAGGFVLWTLVEYWIHRSIFHGNTRYEPMHQLHHALPKDMIGVASVGTFAGFTGLFCSCWMLSCFDTAASITTGFMVGYLFYCAIHVRMHHGDRSKYGRYMAYMFKHHAGHHRGGKGNFGVTTPIWDMAFGSYQKGSNNQASRV